MDTFWDLFLVYAGLSANGTAIALLLAKNGKYPYETE